MLFNEGQIKTLLIDNYDSFTYNLYHLITSVNKHAPIVLYNDDPKLASQLFLKQFDNIVISPGPGHPENEEDFGLCSKIIQNSSLPILGICLGMQGLCCCYGGSVGLAPEPYHGRRCVITHKGTDIFQGMKSPLSVVRYHSLCITNLPSVLIPTAYTSDGIIMAVAHRSRPQWGVQFHPESICTDDGQKIFENFKQLTLQYQSKYSYTKTRSIDEINIQSSRQASKIPLRIQHKSISVKISSDILYDKYFRSSQYSAWLDSNRTGYGTGRYSILCKADGPLGRIVRYSVKDNEIEITWPLSEKKSQLKGNFFDWLKQDLSNIEINPPPIDIDFSMGWVGYLGYELKACAGAEFAHTSEYPDACMIFCDRAIVIDHQNNQIHLLALTTQKDNLSNNWLIQTLHSIQSLNNTQNNHSCSTISPKITSSLHLLHDRTHYLRLIKKCQDYIKQGQSYEICLTNTAIAKTEDDPWSIYQLLRLKNPAPYSAFLKLDTSFILSCSPENFMSISRSGIIRSKPIKGTASRSSDPKADLELKKTLSNSEKDLAENLMIVDLVRHDLGKTALHGTVKVPKLFDIETYQTVFQMVSTVISKKDPSFHSVDCVREAFPGGSMTGAPKLRTMQLIDQLENHARGIYSGAIGYFSLCGAVDLSIVIRTIIMHNGQISFGVGGAITALSDPDEEFQETETKAKAFLDLFSINFLSK